MLAAIVAAVAVAVGMASPASAGAPAHHVAGGYRLIDLGTLGGSYSEVRAVNDAGTAVGVSSTTSGDYHAFVGGVGGLKDLGAVDYASLRIFVNERNQVVWSTDEAGAVAAGVYSWSRRTGTRRIANSGIVADVNKRGQIVGSDAGQAVIWTPGSGRRALGAPAGATSSAAAINDNGEVAGTAVLPDGTTRALRWDRRGRVQDLGPGTAADINARGQVAGAVGPCGPAYDQCGFLWSKGSARKTFAISPPSGVTDFTFFVNDLSDTGVVVGQAFGAFVWSARRGVRHIAPSEAMSSSAVAVNNRAAVAGDWQDPTTDTDKAFVWSSRLGHQDLGPFVIPVSRATDINERGVVAGFSAASNADIHATLWVPAGMGMHWTGMR